MKLLILGGSGFVSRRLLTDAWKAGHDVWYVTRGNHAPVPGATALVADRNDPEALRTVLSSARIHWDAVLDCICFNGTQARIDLAILPEFTQRIVAISTDSVYHPHFKNVPQSEDGERYLDDGLYGALKRQVELVYLNECPSSVHWTLFRPPHMYGAPSELGCFPEHTRQKDLVVQLRSGEPVRLVGGGTYLLQPLYVGDLTRAMLACIDNPKTFNEIFCIAGPDIIQNRDYYTLLGELLQVPVSFEEIPEDGYLEAHPDCSVYLCDRVYDLSKLRSAGLPLPSVSLRDGLTEQLQHILSR